VQFRAPLAMPGRMRTLRAAAAATLVAGAIGQTWTGWPNCVNQELLAEKEVVQLTSQANRRLQQAGDVIDRATFQEAHQIVRLNNYTGKLEVNHNAALWNELETTPEEIHIVVVYGVQQDGSSLLASMLGCAMTDGDEDKTTEFPSAKGKDDVGDAALNPHTLGLWASDPVKFKPADSAGPEKTYVIMDVQGMKHTTALIPGLTKKVLNDASVKMNAMLSEIASEFIYIGNKRAEAIDEGQMADFGLAMKTTRESLVRAGKDFESDEDQKVNIRSTDHPGLIFVTRENTFVGAALGGSNDVVDADLKYLESAWDKRTVTQHNTGFGSDAGGKGLKAVMEANFKNHSLTVDGAQEEVPWLFHPLARVDHGFKAGDAHRPFLWPLNSYPFRRSTDERKQGDACRHYKLMKDDTNLQCQISAGDGAKQPSTPTTYRVLVDGLAKEIYDHAPNRKVTYGSELELAEPQPLTGTRTKAFLEASVTEINKAGPVRDNELWRLIMEDRCFKDYANFIKDHYTNSPGLYNSMINQQNEITATINGEVERLRNKEIEIKDMTWKPVEIAAKNLTFISTWTQAVTSYPTLEDNFFSSNVLLQTVRESCKEKGVKFLKLQDQKAKRIFTSMALLGEEAENRELEAQIDVLKAEVNRLWWAANMPYIIAFTMIGLIAVYMLMNMFGQVCQTCKACASCCGDLQTTDHEHKIIHQHIAADGTEMNGPPPVRSRAAPLIPGVAVAPAAMGMPGGADPALQQRIEELEAVVLQLAAKVPKKDLQEMNLKGV